MNVVRHADDARASRSPEGSARISSRESLMVAPAAERAASAQGFPSSPQAQKGLLKCPKQPLQTAAEHLTEHRSTVVPTVVSALPLL